jgi:hypothetical protein
LPIEPKPTITMGPLIFAWTGHCAIINLLSHTGFSVAQAATE